MKDEIIRVIPSRPPPLSDKTAIVLIESVESLKETIEKALSTLGIELEDADTIEFQEIIPGITPPKNPLLIKGLENLSLLPGWTIRDPGGKVLNQRAHISLGSGETPEPPVVPRVMAQVEASSHL